MRSEGQEVYLEQNVTFDEASILNPTISQQVEIENTKRVSQQVESDATPPSLDRSVLFEITAEVTHGGDHVADEDDDEHQGHIMGDV